MNHDFTTTNYKFNSQEETGCPAVGYQDVDVCVPITVKPFGEVGNATVQCLGKPSIQSGSDCCPGKTEGVCKFTISQKLRIEVPVYFGARAEAGEASVDCGCNGYEENSCPYEDLPDESDS